MKIEAADNPDGSELTITVVGAKASAAFATLAEHLGPLIKALVVERAPVEHDEPGVPAELVVPDVDVGGLPSPEDDVDAPVEPEVAAPTAASGEPITPAPAAVFEPGQLQLVDDPTRAEADELIAAGLSAHHIANELGVDIADVRTWQREAR